MYGGGVVKSLDSRLFSRREPPILLAHPRAWRKSDAFDCTGNELIRLAASDHLRLVVPHRDDRMLPTIERQAAVPTQLIRRLEARDERALLA